MSFTDKRIINQDQMLILKDFPLLIGSKNNLTVYEGFIDCYGIAFWIYLFVPKYPKLNGTTIQCSEELKALLSEQQLKIVRFIREAKSLYDFLNSFKNLVEELLSMPNVSTSIRKQTYAPISELEGTLYDLSEVCLKNIVHVSEALDEIHLKCVDTLNREHVLKLKKGESKEYLMSADLPQKVMVEHAEGATIMQYYKSFEKQIQALQEFWNMLDEIDEECWVIDPDPVSRSHNYRRINIGNNVTMNINLDPQRLYCPEIRILGSNAAIQPFTDAMARSFDENYVLEPGMSIVSYLLSCIDLPVFPSKPEEEPMEVVMQLVKPEECCICYVISTDFGEIPEVTCENEKCGNIYHNSCLYQWLDSLQHQIRYKRMHGNCPNCSTAISCKVP